ncbi:MAG: glycosyltransferase family 2 protein [Candidatus Nanoarchaeia archaeon]
MKLSILIPVYNEEKTIREILPVVENVDIGDVEKEIVLVNDGSADKSGEILDEYKDKYVVVHHEVNKGKGAAIQTAIKHATGDFVIVQDADLEYDPSDYKSLLQPLINKECDVVYGSRFLKKNKSEYQLYMVGNWALSLITSILYFKRITDMETCYKVFSKHAIDSITITRNRFDMEPEITAKLLRGGFKIKELPISYEGRSKEEGKKIGVSDGILALWVLIRYRFFK